MGFAAELALSKKAFGESIYNKNKEDEKMSDITKNRSNPFVVKGLEEIFIQMMSISRSINIIWYIRETVILKIILRKFRSLSCFRTQEWYIQVFQALFRDGM